MITRFAQARAAAAGRPTWRLRRSEARARRRAGQLGAAGVTRWAAERAELAARGCNLPAADDRTTGRRRWRR